MFYWIHNYFKTIFARQNTIKKEEEGESTVCGAQIYNYQQNGSCVEINTMLAV